MLAPLGNDLLEASKAETAEEKIILVEVSTLERAQSYKVQLKMELPTLS